MQHKTRDSAIAIFTFAFLLRILYALLGHNFDVESYFLVGRIFDEGHFPYGNTYRYNYGPPWAFITGGFYQINQLFGGGIESFHVLIAAFLALIDLGIAKLLKHHFSFKTAWIFLFLPIGVLITGYHSQFDNLAIFLGLIAWLEWEKADYNIWKVCLFLTLSICTKHILIFLPLWWIWDNRKASKHRLIILTVPILGFLLSFLPFLFNEPARQGIINYVFLYESADGHSLIPLVLTKLMGQGMVDQINTSLPAGSLFTWVMVLSMLTIPFLLRRGGRYNRLSLPIYLLALFAFSSAQSDQYQAIPLIAYAIYFRSWFLIGAVISASLFLLFRSPHNVASFDWFPLIQDWQGLKYLASWYLPQALVLAFLVQGIVESLLVGIPKK